MLNRKPDYERDNLTNLMASIGLAFGRKPGRYPALDSGCLTELDQAQHVVLLVIDGLGYRHIRRNAQGGVFNAYLKGSLTTVFPATTATAVTTLMTGVAPQQHGLTGWYMRLSDQDNAVAVLPWRRRDGETPAGLAQELHTALPFVEGLEVDAVAILPQNLTASAYSRAYYGRSRMLGYATADQCWDQIENTIRMAQRRSFVQVYWPRLDALSHQYGVNSPEVFTHLMELAFYDLLQRLEGTDTCVLVTADHGFIDAPEAHHLSVHEHPDLARCLRSPLCGEPRAAYAYLNAGSEAVFDELIATRFQHCVESVASETLLQAGWFGLGNAHPELKHRIGDRVLLMKDDWIIHDRKADESGFNMIGVHGGVSADEQMVPLIAARV